jgi:hypothetical protein
MDGSGGTSGVTLISGSGIRIGDSITLVSGARAWRISVPNSKVSAQNTLIIEVRKGVKWYKAQEFIVTDVV